MTRPSQTQLAELLVEMYGVSRDEVRVIHAPYRVCPLGAHIDHQHGPVTGLTLDIGIQMAFAAVAGREIRVQSRQFPGEIRFEYATTPPREVGDWGDYLRGAVRSLQATGKLSQQRPGRGLVGIFSGPFAESGLSSSAAIGVASLLALEHVNELSLSAWENVRLDQYIENDYLGLQNGILDPATILLSRRDHLLTIDCRAETEQLDPAAVGTPPWSILLVFSGLRRNLVATDYNRRVQECGEAARRLLAAAGRVDSPARLGCLDRTAYERHRRVLRHNLALRAAHFFGECDRVQAGRRAWQAGDLVEWGRLITESGASSIDNYQCGAPPLISLYRSLISTDGVYGARFSGAGFRGCCLAIIDPSKAASIGASVGEAYRREYPELSRTAAIRHCRSGDAARLIIPEEDFAH